MTPFMRFVSAAVALGTALFLSGCVNHSASAPRPKVTMEFAVVESSTEKELTPEQVAALRKAVANYLREQGLTDGRTYYVKVTFPNADPNDEPQWAVVRIGGQAEQTYTVIAAYPGRDDYYPDDFYRTNYSYSSYYPGYYGFSRWGYYDPFDYNYGYYHRPTPPRDHTKPDKPDDKKPYHPPGDWTRWNNRPPTDGTPARNGYAPRTTEPDRAPRDRVDARDVTARSNGRADRPERTYAPPERSSPQPERTYTPPERSYSPPPSPPERSYTPPADTSSSRPEPSKGGIQASREQER
jgi:hypothetical protein